jgi:RimJ/RimL family protein N-acetyltransferase
VTPDLKPLVSPLLIGTIGFRLIDWRNRTAEYLWLLLKSEYRNKGFGKEAEFLLMSYAFDHLNLNKIWLYIFPDNIPARKLHAWTGFKDEGLLRQQVFKGGRYIDLLRIGLLAEEFRARELKLGEEVGLVEILTGIGYLGPQE